MSDRPTVFHDLPAEDFPFTVEFLRVDTEEVVHRIRVTGPGAVEIPPLAKIHGVEMKVRIVRDES